MKLSKDQRRKRKLKAKQQRQRKRLQVVKDRTCGQCTACCTTMGVPELDKPFNTPCEHVGKKGCGIYNTRPQSCRAFKCLWLQDYGKPEHRPDRIGVTLDVTTKDGPLGPAGAVIVAREVWNNASSRPDTIVLLSALSKATPVYLMRRDGGRQIWQDGQVSKARMP